MNRIGKICNTVLKNSYPNCICSEKVVRVRDCGKIEGLKPYENMSLCPYNQCGYQNMIAKDCIHMNEECFRKMKNELNKVPERGNAVLNLWI